jgi:hypothetical protein
MFNKEYKNLIMNSTILFVVASTLGMTLHELGHFIASHIVGAKDTVLYHNYVSNTTENLSLNKIIFVKGAGPFVSLCNGILFQYLCTKQTIRNLTFLFNLYMSVFGYIGFFGYLMIAPIFTYGDTGYICEALNFPMWFTITLAVLGAIILYLIMRSLMRYFVEMGTEEIANTQKLRETFINSLIFYPLIFGIVFTTLLNLPVPTFASLIAPLCSPFTMMWAYGDALKRNYPSMNMNNDLNSINSKSYKWQLLFVLTVFINRLLIEGFSFN